MSDTDDKTREYQIGGESNPLQDSGDPQDTRDAELARLRQENAEHDASFELHWAADMRAIKFWQEKTGKTLVWPDHTDLCVWLLEQLDTLRQENAALAAAVNTLPHQEHCEMSVYRWHRLTWDQMYPGKQPSCQCNLSALKDLGLDAILADYVKPLVEAVLALSHIDGDGGPCWCEVRERDDHDDGCMGMRAALSAFRAKGGRV